MAENEKVFYDANMFRKGETLKDSVLTISGTIKSVNRKTSKQGKDYLKVEFESVLGDKFVSREFGEEYVNSDHKVTFQFPISDWRMDEFLKHPPRWGQYHVCMLDNMEKSSFTRKDGSTAHVISCYGQLVSLGSRRKADGTDRPAVTIFGNGDHAQEKANPAMDDIEILEDDGECLF